MKDREDFFEHEIRIFLKKKFKRATKKELDIATNAVMSTRSDKGFLEALDAAADKWEKYRDEQNKDVEPFIQSMLDTLSLELLANIDLNTCGMKLYRKCRNWLDTFSNNTVSFSGYFHETNQCAFQVKINNRIPLNNQLQVLDVLPHIKPIDGWKRLQVLENTLSEFGCYNLKIDKQGATLLTKTTYGHETVINSYENCEQALAYIHKNHPFSPGYNDDDVEENVEEEEDL